MFYKKSGSQLNGGNVYSSYGLNVDEDKNTVPNTPVVSKIEERSTAVSPKKTISAVKTIIFSVLGAVVLFMFFSAASKIAESGLNIMYIQSVGGNTLDEAYYFELGGIYAGYAMITRALGIFFASTLVWLGFKK